MHETLQQIEETDVEPLVDVLLKTELSNLAIKNRCRGMMAHVVFWQKYLSVFEHIRLNSLCNVVEVITLHPASGSLMVLYQRRRINQIPGCERTQNRLLVSALLPPSDSAVFPAQRCKEET